MTTMRANTKKFIYLAIGYFALCYAPFFVSTLNTSAPVILGFPFTVWYITITILIGCAILYWAAGNVWDGFDAGLEDNTATSGKVMEEIDEAPDEEAKS